MQVTHREDTHTELSELRVLVFLCPVFDLSDEVQTAARAPIISLFQVIPSGKRHVETKGFLDARLSEVHEDV